jgi:hypothetical protein
MDIFVNTVKALFDWLVMLLFFGFCAGILLTACVIAGLVLDFLLE